MKKKMILALLIAVAAGGLFALDLSVGVGGTLRANSSTYSWTSDGKDYLKAMNNMSEDYYNTDYFGGGFFAYFDASYIALSLGMGIVDVSPANSDQKKAMKDAKVTQTFTTFDIGLLGKLPINLGAFTLFPALGVDFRIPIDSVYNSDGKETKWSDNSTEDITEWLSQTWIKFGVGADIPLGEKAYLRPMFLYGIGTINKSQQEMSDSMNKVKEMYTQINHGFDLSLAVGFKL
jgi:hypothetical protein